MPVSWDFPWQMISVLVKKFRFFKQRLATGFVTMTSETATLSGFLSVFLFGCVIILRKKTSHYSAVGTQLNFSQQGDDVYVNRTNHLWWQGTLSVTEIKIDTRFGNDQKTDEFLRQCTCTDMCRRPLFTSGFLATLNKVYHYMEDLSVLMAGSRSYFEFSVGRFRNPNAKCPFTSGRKRPKSTNYLQSRCLTWRVKKTLLVLRHTIARMDPSFRNDNVQ